MKSLRILALFFWIATGFNLSGQIDTLNGRIDTTLCITYDPQYFFYAPYNSLDYNFEWYFLGADTSLATGDSVIVNDQDSLLLFSTSVNANDTILLDTILISLRYYPEVNLLVPPVSCFSDTLFFKDSTIYFDNYTSVTYLTETFEMLMSSDSIIKYFVPNGDSADIFVFYDAIGCDFFSDTIQLKSKFQPQSKFSFQEVCFGDTTVINNESNFSDSLAMFSLDIEGDLASFNQTQDSFTIFLPNNIDFREVYVEIVQEGCIERDTFSIKNKLQPTLEFEFIKTCENEKIQLINSSQNIFSDANYFITINENNYNFNHLGIFTISDTIPDGEYIIEGRVSNQNGCSDSDSLIIMIDSVTYVSFTGLDTTFCVDQTVVTLQGSEDGGEFSGANVTNTNPGQAIFAPDDTLINIEVRYAYINTLGCKDSVGQIVPIIYPKPQMDLSGLSMQYCQFDSATILCLAQSDASTSLFELYKDSIFFDSDYTLQYPFAPDIPGQYQLLNVYTDDNRCFDSLINEFVVYPLPIIALDSLIIIQPGDEIRLGDDSFFEQDVDYTWSNGSYQSYIDVSQPGIYILEAVNNATECMSLDTAKIGFDPHIEVDLVEIRISPNPTSDVVTVRTSPFISGIRLVNVFGEPVILTGITSFNTDSNGLLELDLSVQGSGYYYLMIPQVGNFLLIKT